MNKKQQLLSTYSFVIFFCLSCVQVYSQTSYTEEALTGRDGLILEGTNFKLQKEALIAFEKLQKDALRDGISIQIVSAYRSYKRQKQIWNKKYDKYISEGMSPQKTFKKIIEYSTIPGTSRHHWGTEIDIIDANVIAPNVLLVSKNYEYKGVYSKLKKWMDKNAEKFGFYLVYDNNSNRKGFKYEPWHYSYKDLSKPMLKEFLLIKSNQILKNNNIKGSDLFSNEFLRKYYSQHVLEINSKLK